MPIWRRTGGVWRQTRPYLHDGTSFTETPVVKGWVRRDGTWQEFWPSIPDAPAVTVNTVYRNDRIEVDTSWTNPGGTAQTRFSVRIVFINRSTGARSPSAWVTLGGNVFAYTFTNAPNGWGHRSLVDNVVAEVIPYSGNDTVGYFPGPTAVSAPKQVVQYPAPPAPTAWDVDVQNHNYTATWSYTDTRRLTNFEIQTGLDGRTPVTYTVPRGNRVWYTEPWTPSAVGARHTLMSRIRAVGPGGASAWVTVNGVLPGPINFEDLRWRNGGLQFVIRNNTDGVRLWAQRYEGSLEWALGRTTSNNVAWEWVASNSLYRDGQLRYRFRAQPEAANGWTGKMQYSAWTIKMPNPAYFSPTQTMAFRNNSAFYTSSDGRFVYQGMDWNGNHHSALAWYDGKMFAQFAPSRIGYETKASSIHVALRRYASGGAGGGTQVRWELHNQKSYTGAIPTFSHWHLTGRYLVWNESAWVPAPTYYWSRWLSGQWHGIAARAGTTDFYMVLWRHLTATAGSLDGWPYWTIRVVHDG